MKIPCIIFLSFLSFFSSTYGEEAKTRTCRILFLERPADAPKLLHLFDGTTFQEVDLPSMNFSPAYNISSGKIQLRLLPAKVEDPKTISPDAPSVEITADFNDLYLLISSDPDNKITPVKIEAISLDSERFKVGQAMWFNRTDKTIEAKFGDQILSLEPDSSKIIDTPFSSNASPNSGYFSAVFTYRAKSDDPFSPITEQQWWYDINSRHVGFIQNSGGKLPKIYFFRDFRS
jgi:hypothetical protein